MTEVQVTDETGKNHVAVDTDGKLDIKATDLDVSVTTVKPDGTNTLPSGDAVARAIFTKITDGISTLSIDDDSLPIINHNHYEVHKGTFYGISHFFDDLANGANADVLIKVGANKTLHINVSVYSSGFGTIYFYEDTTASNNGTAITIYNMNRTSDNTSNATTFYTPTVTDVGTQLIVTGIPGGEKKNAIGGIAKPNSEFILAKSKNYMVRVNNSSGDTSDVIMNIEWYEED